MAEFMTYSLTRYKSYQEYLDDAELSHECNYRLLSTGELIEVAAGDDDNLMIATVLGFFITQLNNGIYKKRVRTGKKELQVPPVGDKQVNRKPDLIVLQPEHRESARQAVKFGMRPPLFVAEIVSPGAESSINYQRDYVWKRQQYEWWQIPEYWIIDPHRNRITVLVLTEGVYQETVYASDERVVSTVFPDMALITRDVLNGDL